MAAAAAWLAGFSSSQTLTVGNIAARETVALKRADRFVVRVRTAYSETWADLATLRARTIVEKNGRPLEEGAYRYFVNSKHAVLGSVTTAMVWYQSRAWVSYDVTHLPLSSHARAGQPGETIEQAVLGPLALLGPPLARPALLQGTGNVRWVYRRVGSQDIDGQPAFELQTHWPKSALSSPTTRASVAMALRFYGANDRFDVWLNKATYLPVREQIYNGTNLVSDTEIAWLPRNSTNLALLKLKVPTAATHSVVACNSEDTGCSFRLG